MLGNLALSFRARFGKWKKEPLIPFLFLCVTGGLLLFVKISDSVRDQDFHAFDRWLLIRLRESHDFSDPLGPSYFEGMVRDVTALGSFTVLTGLTIFAFGAALFTGKPRTATIMVVAVLSASVLTNFLKDGFDRPRPDLVPHAVQVTTPSFPSGHATMSAVVYLTLGVLLARTQPRLSFRLYLIAAAVVIALMVGLSRIYLGVHWPTDVLAGWALGASWALLFQLIASRIGD